MGNLMKNFCCVDNDDLIYNMNYPKSFTDSLENNKSLRKSNFSRMPEDTIAFESSRNKDLAMPMVNSASNIPICTKDVIIAKKGNPFEDYEIITKLGEGTFGKVYKVRNKTNNAIRAMKQIGKYWLDDINDKEVMKEIEILKKLNHPYIIKLYEYYVTDDSIFLINELCEEGDLHGKMRKIGRFPEFIVKIIMLQIFKALMYLNEKRIIHGDLKLENILVECYDDSDSEHQKEKNKKYDGFIEAIKHDMDLLNQKINSFNSLEMKNGKDINNINRRLNEKHQREAINSYGTTFRFRAKPGGKSKSKNIYDLKEFKISNYGIKLIDFGCSKMFTRTKKNFSDIIGTLIYCSPEVIANNYNESCDIWSCGVLMYCLLSGNFPFRGEDEEEITRKIISGKYEFDIDNFNGVSNEAKDLISKCLKYDINKRIKIHDALNHRFFDDLKESNKFTEEDKIKLYNLKHLNKGSKFYQLVLTYLSYNFSDNKLLNELTKLYDKLDKNTDYKLTKGELYKAYKEAQIPVTEEEVDKVVNSIDFDMNGTIEYEEFIRMCIPKEKLFTDENLENAFLLFDTEKKGIITPQEIADFIQSHKNISPEIKKKIKDEISNTADEIIELEDFKKLMIDLSNEE